MYVYHCVCWYSIGVTFLSLQVLQIVKKQGVTASHPLGMILIVSLQRTWAISVTVLFVIEHIILMAYCICRGPQCCRDRCET